MSFTEFYSNIFQGNTERYILLKEITPDGKKITTQPHGLFPFEKHLDPKEKPYGLSPIQYTNEGKALCRWIGFDRDEEVDNLIACKSAWAIDTELYPFKSTSGRWHYFKFFDEPIDVLKAKEIKDKYVRTFKNLKWDIDEDKCVPDCFSIKEKTPGSHLYLPRFYDGTQCYSPRGEPLTKEQFQFRFENRKHPLISGSVGLTSGNNSRQKHLFNIGLYLKHTKLKPLDFLETVNKNFNEPETDKEVQHAINRAEKDKYDLKHLVKNYASYTESMCGWKLGLSEALQEVCEEPGNDKALIGYKPPDSPGQVLGFEERIVYCKKEDMFWDLQTWDNYKKNAINNTFQHIFTKKPELQYAQNPDKLIVEETDFIPSEYKERKAIFKRENKLYLNTYKPKGVEPLSREKCKLYDFYLGEFLTNINNIFCGHNSQYVNYFLDFLAYIVQYPGYKIRQIPFLCSKAKQLGKGLIFETMQKILHKDYARKINTRTALDKGMTFLHESLFILIDEVYLKGDYKQMRLLMDKIKLLATEQEHTVRTLYRDERTVWSNTCFIMQSNYPDAISFDEQEERYFYIKSEGKRLPGQFYKDYYWKHLVEGQMAECVKHFFLNRVILTKEALTKEQMDEDGEPKVPLFVASGTAHKTEDFYDRVKGSGTDSKQLTERLVKENEEPFRFDIVCISEAHKYLKDNDNKYNESLNVLAEAWEELGYKKLGECKHKKSGKKPTLWNVRNFKNYEKIANTTLADMFWIPIDKEKYDLGLPDTNLIKKHIADFLGEEADLTDDFIKDGKEIF